MCCYSYSCFSGGCYCYCCGGSGYSGCCCNPGCGPVAGSCGIPLDTSNLDCALPDAPGEGGVAGLGCSNDSGQSMSGNTEGGNSSFVFDSDGNPVPVVGIDANGNNYGYDANGNFVDADGNCYNGKVDPNNGAGYVAPQGGQSGQTRSGGGSSGGSGSGGGMSAGGGGSKPAQQPAPQNQNQASNQLNQLISAFSRLGTNFANAVKGAPQVTSQAVVGQPNVQAAGIVGSGDMLIVIVVVVLLGSMLFIEKEG